MRHLALPLFVLTLGILAHGAAIGQVVLSDVALRDTLHGHRGFRIATSAEAFFYNAEFDHPLKVGYTLPGWVVQPGIAYHYGNLFSLDASWYVERMVGLRAAWRAVPLLRLVSSPIRGVTIALGAVRATAQHELPDYVYSPQYRWLAPPEQGVQIEYRWRDWRVETWVDWERFIWRGAEDNERFLYGIRAAYGAKVRPGLYAHAFLLAHHSGGQIDATQNPVVTSSNLGVELAYQWFLGASLLCVEVSGARSRDGDRSAPLADGVGWLLRGKAAWCVGGLTLEAGYVHGQRFYTLRGEELYASYSSWSEGRHAAKRNLLTLSPSYEYALRSMLKFRAGAMAFYDAAYQRVDWAFMLSTAVDLNFWLLSHPPHP